MEYVMQRVVKVYSIFPCGVPALKVILKCGHNLIVHPDWTGETCECWHCTWRPVLEEPTLELSKRTPLQSEYPPAFDAPVA